MKILKDVYINSLAAFLPNEPIKTKDIEKYIGEIQNGMPQRIKDAIHKTNGIEQRYYALKEGGEVTHLTEDLAYFAASSAIETAPDICASDIDLISFGTTNGDLFVPTLTHQVHAQLGEKSGVGRAQIVPVEGVCLSGITGLMVCENLIASGKKKCAVVGGAERASVAFLNGNYLEEGQSRKATEELFKSKGYSVFHTEFLRYLLSDGAGAAVLSAQPNSSGPSLKIDWIETSSYAFEAPLCMWAGAPHTHFTCNETYYAQESFHVAAQKGMMGLRQDPTILNRFIVKKGIEDLKRLIAEGMIDPPQIKWLLPHLSSFAFKAPILHELEKANIDLGAEKWFTNLGWKGNSGAAAIFIMLEECLNAGHIKPGDKVLAFIPESARFNYGFCQFTCV